MASNFNPTDVYGGTNYYIQKLPDLEFFAGNTITIPFVFYDSLMNPIDLHRVDVYWYLCPYGRYKTPSLILSDKQVDALNNPKILISDVEPNLCYVNLSYEDTKKLAYIKYTQQPVLILKNSRGIRRYIRAEGNLLFLPYIEDFNTTIGVVGQV